MNLEALRRFRLPPVHHNYSVKDTILYALGLGFGERPTDSAHLQFVYEKCLRAVPSLCVVLAQPGFWIAEPSLEIDALKVVHGEQSFEVFHPLSPEGQVRGEFEIAAIEDKGADKGAHLHLAKRLYDCVSGELLANVTSVYVLRGDGGQGGFGVPTLSLDPVPDSTPDSTIDIKTLPQSALLYRLTGDMSEIHADPGAATRAGFVRPILHGLCSMGIATRAVIEILAGGAPDGIRSVSLRFARPVVPGDVIRVEMYKTAAGARLRARVPERDVVVLDRGTASFWI